MEQPSLCCILLLSFFLFLVLLKFFLQKQSSNKNMPPSPPSFPIIGHLHLLRQPFPQCLQKLSQKYGPIFSLKLGNRSVVIVSSPSAIEECFTKNDKVFANRPHFLATKYLNYNHSTIVAAPYGPLWKNLHRIAKLEIFSPNRLNKFSDSRRDEIKALLKELYMRTSYQNFAIVEMKSKITELSINIITMMLSGKRYFGEEMEDKEVCRQFRDLVQEMFELAHFNPVDFVPFLQLIGYQNLEKRMQAFQTRSDAFLQNLLDEHRCSDVGSSSPEQARTMVDAFLSMQELEPEYCSDELIKGILLIMLTVGIETSSTTIEWAMSLLINHPEVLKKARDELDDIVGNDRLVSELDVSELPYLQSIINETLRLFPAVPLLVPHESSDDCNIAQFHVPRKSMLLANAWAIHRDPQLWEESESFNPERFLGLESDAFKFKFIPFGLARRSCPGAGLANRVVALTLGSLIQCFELERTSKELVDMSERIGITMPKAKPLVVKFKSRQTMIKTLAGF